MIQVEILVFVLEYSVRGINSDSISLLISIFKTFSIAQGTKIKNSQRLFTKFNLIVAHDKSKRLFWIKKFES